jgi:hypothetical protein
MFHYFKIPYFICNFSTKFTYNEYIGCYFFIACCSTIFAQWSPREGWLNWEQGPRQGHFQVWVARGMANASLWWLRVVDAFVRSWATSKSQRCWFPCGYSQNHFRIISKPLMCATNWIKHLGVIIVASPKGCKFLDGAWRFVYVGIKKEPTISRLRSLRIIWW